MIAKPSHERNSQKSEPGLVDQDAAISCILLSLSLSSPNTLLLISSTASNPSLPLNGFGVRMSFLRSDLSYETRSGSLQLLQQASQFLKQYDSGRYGSKKLTHLLAFSRKRSTLASSILDLIFCQPPHNAVILASCSNLVRSWPGSL